MRIRNRVFVIAFIIQFIIVLAIVLFPEKIKIEKFTNYRALIKPTSIVEYPITPPNEIRKKISELNVFSKFNGTRGITVQDRNKAIIIITNSKFEESFHFDRLMVEAYSRGIGSVFIDPRDTPQFVSILKEDGTYYTSKERQEMFFSEIIEYMKDIGYRTFSLWIFGEWFESSITSVENKAVIDSIVIVSNKYYENYNLDINVFPPVLLIVGDESTALEDNRNFYNNLSANNIDSEILILKETSHQLKNASGKLDKDVEERTFDSALLWAENHFVN